MRVALLSSDWTPSGGVATYVRSLASALADAGHPVLVVHGESAGPDEGLPFEVAAAPGVFLARAASDPASTLRVVRFLDAFAPDVVHVQSCNNFPLEDSVAARWPAVKTFHVHDYCPAGTKYHFGPERACRVRTGLPCVPRMVYLRCTLSRRPKVIWSAYRHTRRANRHHFQYRQLIACSNHVRAQAIFTGFDPARVAVVPYFTQVVEPPRGSEGREILALGRLVRSKGFDLLLEALKMLGGPWTLVVAGEGMERSRLERRAAELGLAGRVSFAGWLSGAALSAAYARAAVVAIPSRWPEPFGIVGLEALAHSRPVVAFGVGGIPEWLEEGIGGSIVPPMDVRRLSERLGWMLDHPEERARAAALGRERVAREFSAPAHLRRLIPLYEHAVA